MPVLVDYRCTGCGAIEELKRPSPPPATMACRWCGAPAKRLFGSVGLVGRVAGPAPPAPAPTDGALCRRNPDVPLLCHVDPAMAPGWVARYRGDNRALEDHLAKSERGELSSSATSGGRHHHHHHPHASNE